jgi:hypothetical protein
MKLSISTSIFLAIITASLITITGSRANAQPCGKTFREEDMLCGSQPIPANNLDIEKNSTTQIKQEVVSTKDQAKEIAEARRVEKTESDRKIDKEIRDCFMRAMWSKDEDSIREYIFPHEKHRKNSCY